MLKYILLVALIGFASSSSKISPTLLSSLETNKVANIMVNFVGGNTEVVQAIEVGTFATRAERATTLTASLKSHTKISQELAQNLLEQRQVAFKSFWISNQIYIQGADVEVVQSLAALSDVEEIYEERIIPLHIPVARKAQDPTPLAEWGIMKIQADEAWKITNGTGIVVSNIDTGVRGTHEALRDNFRTEYGWFDPYRGAAQPTDPEGHGTHTMGTIAGSNGIGVAPGVQWIACRGCDGSGCSDSGLTGCAQWVLCPTLPDGSKEDCSKAPALVSNSWGGGRGNLGFQGIVDAWIAAGMIPIFSIGNSGPNCATSNSPGDLRRAIGVGATDIQDQISRWSSVGPAVDGRIKPEISAPGESIRSAGPMNDGHYWEMSGTSMACPHVSGTTALLLSINPDLTYAQVRQALILGVDISLTSQNKECEGIPDSTFPNYHFGYGRINALKTIEAAKLVSNVH